MTLVNSYDDQPFSAHRIELTEVLVRLTSRSAYLSAWDHFINSCAKGRWLTVGLTNGDVYAGYVDKADVSVAASERDVILREPALRIPRISV